MIEIDLVTQGLLGSVTPVTVVLREAATIRLNDPNGVQKVHVMARGIETAMSIHENSHHATYLPVTCPHVTEITLLENETGIDGLLPEIEIIRLEREIIHPGTHETEIIIPGIETTLPGTHVITLEIHVTPVTPDPFPLLESGSTNVLNSTCTRIPIMTENGTKTTGDGVRYHEIVHVI